jgi:lactoylglutathione lyase
LDRFVGMMDDAGLLITISNLDSSEVVYPKSFHIGFKRDSDAIVDSTYDRLMADGFSVGERQNLHGAWTFYLTAPGGFTVEVMHQREKSE